MQGAAIGYCLVRKAVVGYLLAVEHDFIHVYGILVAILVDCYLKFAPVAHAYCAWSMTGEPIMYSPDAGFTG